MGFAQVMHEFCIQKNGMIYRACVNYHVKPMRLYCYKLVCLHLSLLDICTPLTSLDCLLTCTWRPASENGTNNQWHGPMGGPKHLETWNQKS